MASEDARVDQSQTPPGEEPQGLGPLAGEIPRALLYLVAILAIAVTVAVLALGVIPT